MRAALRNLLLAENVEHLNDEASGTLLRISQSKHLFLKILLYVI